MVVAPMVKGLGSTVDLLASCKIHHQRSSREGKGLTDPKFYGEKTIKRRQGSVRGSIQNVEDSVRNGGL